MNAFWTTVRDSFHQLITPERLASTARAVIFLVVGFPLAKLAARALERVLRRTLEPTQAFLVRRIANYVLLALVVASALVEMGFGLSLLLGAAGVLTVALGFASQASAPNLISGLFLVVERPFAIGDTVRIGDHTGEVLAIDLLSTKLRTFDNLFVRVPNESVMKGEVINCTRFPIRRIDLQVQVAYKEDQKRVREVLTEVVDADPRCLEEPRPQIFFQGCADSGVNLQLSFWTAQGNYVEVKSTLPGALLDRLRQAEIEIPFPHRKILQDPAAPSTDR